ncbi:hypothetical protein [Streptomyces sp. NPDC050485]|uniref:hypothetical protein n=1 Tax=Streptomyces sp. NPDC050485 TaxID=3365617 RepID=UPI003793EE50
MSSVVNNTDRDNILFTRTNQGGSQLPVPANSVIADLTRVPLAGSATRTWNDQAQSALAFNKPVPLPAFTAPRPSAQTQDRRQAIQGNAAPDVQQVLLYEGSKLLGTCPLKDSKWEYAPDADWPLGQHDLAAIAVRDDVQSGKTPLRFYVTLPTPVVDIRSPKEGVEVDSGATVDGVAFNADTVSLAEGGTQLGTAKVTSNVCSLSPPEGVHIVPTKGNLTIRVLVLIPTQDAAYHTLYGLFASRWRSSGRLGEHEVPGVLGGTARQPPAPGCAGGTVNSVLQASAW